MSGFESMLADYDAVARRAALDHLSRVSRSPHLSPPVADYVERPGKGLRPALCMATCEAFGGRADDAVPTAVALELLHTAFLVHDDVEDDSHMRRGEPTLHRRYGRAVAVNAGDGLALFALEALRDNDAVLGRRLSARLWGEFDFMARQTVEGQARELAWRTRGHPGLTPDDYLELIMQKTCWYTTVLPLRAGALIGSHGGADLDPLLRFGFFLGAAFQIRDDILNLTASGPDYGKEHLGDLREGKRTLMLIHLLAVTEGARRDALLDFLDEPPSQRTPQMAAAVLGMMHEHGSITFAEHFATGIAESAHGAYEEAFRDVPDSAARRFIGELIDYMIERDR